MHITLQGNQSLSVRVQTQTHMGETGTRMPVWRLRFQQAPVPAPKFSICITPVSCLRGQAICESQVY